MKEFLLWWLSFWTVILNKLMPWTKAVHAQSLPCFRAKNIKTSSCLSSFLSLSLVIPAVGWKQTGTRHDSCGVQDLQHISFQPRNHGFLFPVAWPTCHNLSQPTNSASSPPRRFGTHHHLCKTWTMATLSRQHFHLIITYDAIWGENF